MINNIPQPERVSRPVAGNPCKKLSNAKKRAEKQVSGDIQGALSQIASNINKKNKNGAKENNYHVFKGGQRERGMQRSSNSHSSEAMLQNLKVKSNY